MDAAVIHKGGIGQVFAKCFREFICPVLIVARVTDEQLFDASCHADMPAARGSYLNIMAGACLLG